MGMDWIVPENKLDIVERAIIGSGLRQNLCIKGGPWTDNTSVFIHLLRRIVLAEKEARVIVLSFNNLTVELYRKVIHEIGLKADTATYHKFKRTPRNYDYILCDNVQNISFSTFNTISNFASYLIVTIDPYIKLFENDSISSEPTLSLNEIENVFAPKIFELIPHGNGPVLYRIASRILGMNSVLKFSNLPNVDSQINICKAINEIEELRYIIRKSKRCLSCGYSCVILLPTHHLILSFFQNLLLLEDKQPWIVKSNKWGKTDYSALNNYLDKIGVPFQFLGNDSGELSNCYDKICVMSYFSSQGLKFDYVFIPNMNSDTFINSNNLISRNAFALAITRSRYSPFITYCGERHEFLYEIENDCIQIDISKVLTGDSSSIFEGF